jgi:hypothetical protein
MASVDITTHRGKRVVLVDLAHSQPAQSTAVLPQAHRLIAVAGPKSALVLTDVTNATYNKDVAAAIKEFVSKNTPHIKASAVVGADGVRGILLQTVIFLTRREIKTFDNRAAALDWLATI